MNIEEHVTQIINEQDIPLDSLKVKDDLNPKFWDKENNYKLRPDIRDKLMEIAQVFEGYLDLPSVGIDDAPLIDVIFTGSLANYNWSKYSDVDVHLVMNFNNIDKKYLPLFEAYVKFSKDRFADTHDIRVEGYEVELYAQNVDHDLTALGVYSIKNDSWVKFPPKHTGEIDLQAIEAKSKNIMVQVDAMERNIKLGGDMKNHDIYILRLRDIWQRIKDMRKSGLETGGEFSTENMVFKVLRRNGYISKVLDLRASVIADKLSM